jgi:CheY-like chemotaxis protein
MPKEKLRCILLVDDDEVTNFINSELIEEAGVTEYVKVCEDGEIALEYLKKAHAEAASAECMVPDLIFLDLNMPGMNGTEFLQEYKKRFKESNTVITMLSTTQIPEEVYEALTATNLVVSFLEKPLTKEKLQDLVNGILRVYYHNCNEQKNKC